MLYPAELRAHDPPKFIIEPVRFGQQFIFPRISQHSIFQLHPIHPQLFFRGDSSSLS
jgi:hypothetical protein